MSEKKKRVFVPREKRENIGTYHPRTDGLAKANGTAEFAADMTSSFHFPNLLYMKILKSPYPRARIKSIDTAEAEAVAGFKGLIRYDDPEIEELPFTSDSWTDAVNSSDKERGWTAGALDRKILGREAYWVGDELGVAVAADSIEAAEEAIKKIKVEWEILPFVLSVEDAKKKNAPVIHPEVNPDSNFIPYFDFWGEPVYVERGNVDKAFEEAEVTVEAKASYSNPTECAMDYWCVMVDWRLDEVLVLSDSYGNDQTRYFFHEMFGLPINQIHVITPFEGGQHGRGNTGEQQFFILAAMMSRKLGRPVKYQQTRKEHFHTTRTAQKYTIKIAAKKDGTITAYETNTLGDSGAYYLLCGGSIKGVPSEWAELSGGHIENVRMTGNAVYTNIIPSSCMRSIGNIQFNFLFGLGLDMLAEKLHMDPTELAVKNLNNPWDPHPNPSLMKVIEEGKKAIGWDRRHPAGEGEWFEGTKKRGIGFSCNNTWHTEAQEYRRGPTQVLVKLNPDGSVILDAPTVETGPGSNTCAVLACAEGLGVSPSSIKWIYRQDTETGLKDQVQTDSGAAALLAECAYECAKLVKNDFLEAAAKKLGCNPEDLDMKNGRAFLKADNKVGLTIKEYYKSIELFEEGNMVPISRLYVRPLSLKNYGHAYMATFAEVEVDTETGNVKVLSMAISTDGGTVLYPSGAEAQMVGGQCQGLGEAMYEYMIYDEKTGKPLNFNFVDYKFPTFADMPENVDPLPVEVYRGHGNFGAMGMGEGAPCCTPRAIANAVYNAVGIRINDAPLTPMKILDALEEKEVQ